MRTLNSIDRNLQRILMKAEERLKPRTTEVFTEKLVKVKQERKYWRSILYKRKRLSEVGLQKIWEGHKIGNVILPVTKKLVALKEAEEKVQHYYKRKYERREKFLEALVKEYGLRKTTRRRKQSRKLLETKDETESFRD